MSAYPVIDADGHVTENDEELYGYLEGRYRRLPHYKTFSFFPSLDGWQRGFTVPDKDVRVTAERWIEFLDELGVQMSVLYPTAGLALGLIQDPEWACAVARAYNNWLYDRYTRPQARLMGVALLPVHDPNEAAGELRRTHEQLGFVAGLLPAVTILHKGYGDRCFDPIYRTAEELDIPLAVHGAPSRGLGFDFFDKFIEVHTLEHPVAIFTQFVHMVFEGVFERFPRLRVAYLEAGSGWLPYLMDRMDEEFAKPFGAQVSYLTRRPTDTIRSGQVWTTCEVEEQSLPQVLRQFNANCVMWPSDYPHERRRHQFRGDLPTFLAREDLSDELKRKILFDNPTNFYRLDRS